jgi:catechol 2,3-dioxygenase-like lactoylglutathione lyase family enzyme
MQWFGEQEPSVTPTVFSTTVLADDVATTARFYIDHFGFGTRLDIGWFVVLHHDDRPYEMCVIARDHDAVPAAFRTAPAGVIVAFMVDDVDAVAARLAASEVPVVTPVRDEPWGQRHTYVTDPAGTLIDVVQLIPPDPDWLAVNGLTTA